MVKKKIKFAVFTKYAATVSTVFAASVTIGVVLSSTAADVLALGKSDDKVQITINEINQLAGALEDNDVIEHPLLFSIYVDLCELKEPLDLKSPTATVSADMDYRALLKAFTSPPRTRTVTVTFPKGSTTDEIIDIFLQNGIGTREGFTDVINNYPFEYDFIAEIEKKASEDRSYRLDGYLYPDTYDFYTDRPEAYYIYKMLDRFCLFGSEADLSDQDLS